MKALITGARGTVGTVLSQTLTNEGHTVVAWDRSQVPIDDYHAMESFVRAQAPDVIYHLAIASLSTGKHNEGWLVNYEWASELAWIAKIVGTKLIFTSTVMVFSNDMQGPFTRDSVPDAPAGYGYEKRRAEERVREQNPDATIVRLGWQIGDRAGSNNMIDFFDRQQRDHGHVSASTQWYPATSFLQDTAASLAALVDKPAGLYMIDSNDRWNFFQIASALNRRHGTQWDIVPTEDFVYDQRMKDDELVVTKLGERLPELLQA